MLENNPEGTATFTATMDNGAIMSQASQNLVLKTEPPAPEPEPELELDVADMKASWEKGLLYMMTIGNTLLEAEDKNAKVVQRARDAKIAAENSISDMQTKLTEAQDELTKVKKDLAEHKEALSISGKKNKALQAEVKTWTDTINGLVASNPEFAKMLGG